MGQLLEDPEKQTRRSFQIRRARREDMDLVAGFVRSSAEWYRPIVAAQDMGEHEVGNDWARKNFARRDFYIGSVDGTPVGTVSLQYFGDYAYVGYVYLSVKHVGKGYGQKLLRFAKETAIDRGVRGLALIAHPEAAWAKRAYLKFGFEIVETDAARVKSWNGGALASYYEGGFELYLYEFTERDRAAAATSKGALNHVR